MEDEIRRRYLLEPQYAASAYAPKFHIFKRKESGKILCHKQKNGAFAVSALTVIGKVSDAGLFVEGLGGWKDTFENTPMEKAKYQLQLERADGFKFAADWFPAVGNLRHFQKQVATTGSSRNLILDENPSEPYLRFMKHAFEPRVNGKPEGFDTDKWDVPEEYELKFYELGQKLAFTPIQAYTIDGTPMKSGELADGLRGNIVEVHFDLRHYKLKDNMGKVYDSFTGNIKDIWVIEHGAPITAVPHLNWKQLLAKVSPVVPALPDTPAGADPPLLPETPATPNMHEDEMAVDTPQVFATPATPTPRRTASLLAAQTSPVATSTPVLLHNGQLQNEAAMETEDIATIAQTPGLEQSAADDQPDSTTLSPQPVPVASPSLVSTQPAVNPSSSSSSGTGARRVILHLGSRGVGERHALAPEGGPRSMLPAASVAQDSSSHDSSPSSTASSDAATNTTLGSADIASMLESGEYLRVFGQGPSTEGVGHTTQDNDIFYTGNDSQQNGPVNAFTASLLATQETSPDDATDFEMVAAPAMVEEEVREVQSASGRNSKRKREGRK